MDMATDVLLIQAATPASATEDLGPVLASLPSALGYSRSQVQAVWSAAQNELYVYIDLSVRTTLGQDALTRFETAFKNACPTMGSVRVSRLEKVFDRPGASSGATPGFHYVVETDPEPGWMPEMEKWYDTEHMPGLAAVPGTVRARRFINHDHGPLSLACYDLVSENTLGSAPWLAVRNTPWSSRVRPHFTNTRRTMFRILSHDAPARVEVNP